MKANVDDTLRPRGGSVLVLGSGVSRSRGLPMWDELARRLWDSAFPERSSPWDEYSGNRSPRDVPQFLPIVFELALRHMGQARFTRGLRAALYESARFPAYDPNFAHSQESLAVIARLVGREFDRQGRRRIDSIVTLNADDLLEQAISVCQPRKRKRWVGKLVRVYSRSIGRLQGPPGLIPIPIYHIHGFVPANRDGLYGLGPHGAWNSKYPRFFDHNLVFTDLQYWATTAAPHAFSNRVMTWCLNERRCLFIGLSMTDINVLRWLALLRQERDRDALEVMRFSDRGFLRERGLSATTHIWLRAEGDDPTGFLSEFFATRGVKAVTFKSWEGPHFSRLIERAFP